MRLFLLSEGLLRTVIRRTRLAAKARTSLVIAMLLLTATASFFIASADISVKPKAQTGKQEVSSPVNSSGKLSAIRSKLLKSSNLYSSPVNAVFEPPPVSGFAAGDLIVVRFGAVGGGALSANAAPVFLDEYAPTGTLVQSVPMPIADNGINKAFVNSGSATSEGEISLSSDGQFLVTAGYDTVPGTASITGSTSTAINRVIARVDGNGNIDTTTALTDAISGGNPRGATSTNGIDMWISGTSSGGGIRYAQFGHTTSTSLGTTPTTNLRHTNVFNGQLYVTSASSTIRLATVGTGTPKTAGQTIAQVPGVPATLASPYGFFFTNVSGGTTPDTLYITDDSAGLTKYSFSGGVWTPVGTAINGASGVRGLTGTVQGSTVTLYITSNTGFFSLTDTSGFGGVINGTLTQRATAPANTAFRGVAFAPVGHTAPIATSATANPNSVTPGGTTTLSVTVTPGSNPPSTGISVSADLTAIGGSNVNGFIDNGDGTFSLQATVAVGTTGGTKSLPIKVSDAQGASSTSSISLTVLSPTAPTGVGSANPNPVGVGGTTLLTVNVTPGQNPTSTGLAVTGDLSSIGGSALQQFFDDGSHGDVTAGDHIYSFSATIGNSATLGTNTLPITISDDFPRSSTTSISLTVQAASVPPGAVVISQIYGGGGNSGATLKNDYLELFNRSGSPVDLTGWSLQHTAAALGSWEKTILSGVIQPGEYLLVQESAGAGGTVNLPTPDITGTMTLGATNGTIALLNNSTTLTAGVCPAVGPNRIDLVGYGTGSVCFEGTNFAPTLGNTTAAFRTHNGCKDSDDNSLDFKVGPPAPRNSGSPLSVCPVGDLPPEVFNTTPVSGALSVPVDSVITVQFDESVTVAGSWFNISCATSGIHTATFAGGPTTFTITPDTHFSQLEQCTTTIFASQVTDQASQHMAADFSWNFLTAHDGSEHLLMGNPTNATPDPNNFDNFLMSKAQYALSYNGDRGTSNWVSWHLDQTWLGSAARSNDFAADTSLPPNFYQVQNTDYTGSGFDRGHMCPSADRTSSDDANAVTFLMTNMVPQTHDNNAGPWEDFENYLRTLVAQGNEVYIVSGPAGTGGLGLNGLKTTIANGHVTVPSQTWKVALVLPVGDNDLSRVNASTRTIAIITPNVTGIISDSWQKYIATIDQVKALTGFDFYSNVPVNIKNIITAKLDAQNDTAPIANAQSVTTAEDNALPIQLTASDFNVNNVFTFTVTGGPSHGTLSGTGASLTYTPDQDFFGTDSFTFKANDGALDSDPVTVSIGVTAVNDPPVAFADTESMNWNTTLSFPASDLTANDNAGPGESDQTLTVTAVSGTADTHGSVTLSNGIVNYTPDQNFFGQSSFIYTVCDNGATNGSPDPKCATGTVNVTVILVDVTPPVITVPNDISAEAIGPNGAVVSFTFSANDNIDGPIPATCDHVSGSVFSLGTTIVTCSATDAHNNTGSKSFNITVADTTAPSVIVPGDITAEATGPNGAAVTFTSSATDIVDGPLAVICGPTSGSVFAIGTTVVTCSATDAHHNTGSRTFNVTVRDTTAPIVSVPGNITAEATGPNGAAVTFSVSAIDTVNGNLPVTCNHPSGSVFALGTTTVACSASDTHSNTGSNSFTVTVRDTTRPVLTLPSAIAVEATTPSGAVVTFVATATDLVDGAVPVTCIPASGSTFAIGTTTVACSAVDSHNNAVNGSFTVTVGGARTIKQHLLSDMLALQATLTNKDDIKKFGDIVDDLTATLNSTYWIDDNHLQPKKGQKVFNGDHDTVNDLMNLIKDKKSLIPDSVLQGFINRLVTSDRILAQIAINEATAAHGDSKKLSQANQDMSDASQSIASGKYDNAVNDYGDAWKSALKSMNIDCDD